MPVTERTGWLRDTATGAAIGLALTLVVSAPAVAQSPSSPSATPSGDLSVTVQDQTRLAGEYGLGGSLVTYDTRRRGDEVHLEVTVNGMTLRAALDLTDRSGSWAGDGGILGTDGKVALSGLEGALGSEVMSAPQRRPHEELLYRAVMYWAEAPAGLVLTGDTLETPVERTGHRDGGAAGLGTADGVLAMVSCIDPVSGMVDPAACQVDDDNGISYLPDHVCDGGTAAECHDASGHCWTCSVTDAGVPHNCKGRCGGGCCAPDGLGVFTYDCLDHDHCCGVHGGCWNPWDGDCGDEYFDADDDFLWGTTNCGIWVC